MALASRWLRSGHTCFLNQVIDGLLTKPQKSPEARRCQVLFFLPSAHRFFIASDSLFRPAAVNAPPRFFLTEVRAALAVCSASALAAGSKLSSWFCPGCGMRTARRTRAASRRSLDLPRRQATSNAAPRNARPLAFRRALFDTRLASRTFRISLRISNMRSPFWDDSSLSRASYV
jgi:hypothetical protein